MTRRWLLVLLLAVTLPAAASVPEVLKITDNWQRWGSGEMSWFGHRLYRATLWVGGAAATIDAAPHALTLEYRRAIDRERLVSTSLDEMQRLGASEAQLLRWGKALRQLFPAVREGETITGVHVPGVGARFYHQSRHLGDIDDADFARFFFAIWLDPRTRASELRTALLRRPDGG